MTRSMIWDLVLAGAAFVASIGFGFFMRNMFGGSRIAAMIFAAVPWLLAAGYFYSQGRNSAVFDIVTPVALGLAVAAAIVTLILSYVVGSKKT